MYAVSNLLLIGVDVVHSFVMSAVCAGKSADVSNGMKIGLLTELTKSLPVTDKLNEGHHQSWRYAN